MKKTRVASGLLRIFIFTPRPTTVVRYWHWIHEKEKLDVIPENVWSTLDTYTYICGWPDERDAIMGREEASKREIAEKATGVERETERDYRPFY